MFADPQSVSISGTATSLPRISAGEMNGMFRSGDGATVMSIAHTANRRERSVVRLDQNLIGADPLDTTKQRNYKLGAYLVLDAPLNGVGFTTTQKAALITALVDWLKATGNTAKFVGSES
jgi:hypothetical protein